MAALTLPWTHWAEAVERINRNIWSTKPLLRYFWKQSVILNELKDYLTQPGALSNKSLALTVARKSHGKGSSVNVKKLSSRQFDWLNVVSQKSLSNYTPQGVREGKWKLMGTVIYIASRGKLWHNVFSLARPGTSTGIRHAKGQNQRKRSQRYLLANHPGSEKLNCWVKAEGWHYISELCCPPLAMTLYRWGHGCWVVLHTDDCQSTPLLLLWRLCVYFSRKLPLSVEANFKARCEMCLRRSLMLWLNFSERFLLLQQRWGDVFGSI